MPSCSRCRIRTGAGPAEITQQRVPETCIASMLVRLTAAHECEAEHLEDLDYLLGQQLDDGGWNCEARRAWQAQLVSHHHLGARGSPLLPGSRGEFRTEEPGASRWNIVRALCVLNWWEAAD